jgi:chitin synthase
LEQKDLDQTYDEALMNLKTRPKLLEKNRSDKEKEALKQDYYKSVRTNVVLLWTLTNVSLRLNRYNRSSPIGRLITWVL